MTEIPELPGVWRRFGGNHALLSGCAVLLISFLITAVLLGQTEIYQCPMDPEVRSSVPGVCPRCGMKLSATVPDPVEYPMGLEVFPKPLQAGRLARLEFTISNPSNDHQVKRFQTVHEKLFHLFVVSRDLTFFVHDHPILGEDGKFRFNITFPSGGFYRVAGDYYPDGGTPQLNVASVIVPGGAQVPATLSKDYSSKHASNMDIELSTIPAQPIAATKTLLQFHINPAAGFEKYLGAWGHMLIASDDLVDVMHTHPFLANGSSDIQFNVYFPRGHVYRVWVQFQRRGVVNTAYFDVPVKYLN